MDQKWTMRRFKEEDAIKIANTQNEDLKWFSWKYKESPAGFKNNIWVAVDENIHAGQYIIQPVYLRIKNNKVLGSQSMDTYTSPNYRRQGIFINLATKVLEEAGEMGIPITFGYPNKDSYHGFIRKLSYKHIFNVPELVLIFDLKKFISSEITNPLKQLVFRFIFKILSVKIRKKSNKIINKFDLLEVSEFNSSVNQLFEEFSTDYDVILEKNLQYLNWRYVKNPKKKYVIFSIEEKEELLGFIILREHFYEQRGITAGNIVDIMVKPGIKDVADALIQKAIEYFKKLNVTMVYCWMMKNSWLYNQFNKNGFFQLRPKDRIPVILRENAIMEPPVKSLENTKWFCVLGDADFG